MTTSTSACRNVAMPGSALLAYGALGLPLAFAALPIYVHVPRLYADSFGLPLAAVGAMLLATRIFDALSDPLIGWACDRWAWRQRMIVLALPLLALGLPALLAPPAGAGLAWLGGLLVLVSLGYSAASIAYNAWGAELGRDPQERTRLVASREGFALIGVILAAALPGLLASDTAAGLARLGWLFLPLLAACAAWTLLGAAHAPAPIAHRAPVLAGLSAALAHRPFARLLAIFAANGIAAAIPSATVLFFVADVLQAEHRAGLFLVLYFLAAAASLPLWVAIAHRIGKLPTWLGSMLLACVVFAWAALLEAGDLGAFAAICVLSGIAFGADLALPPALLADLLARAPTSGQARAGAWFGWWNFVTKANLALAAGLALPLLAWLGYAPGERSPAALDALRTVYALLPVALKCIAIALLWRWRTTLAGDAVAASVRRSPSP